MPSALDSPPPKCNTPKPQTRQPVCDNGFPDVPIRTGRQTLNEKIVRCTVQCLADYKVSREDLAGVMVRTENIIFGQKWVRNANLDLEDDQDCSDDSEDTESVSTPQSNIKRRRSAKDLTYVFPSNRCVDKYLEDASYLNLQMAAKKMLDKYDTDVVTVGYDDFTKAAGYGTIHGKADHITLTSPNKPRETLTTGFLENIGHSGSEGAEGYEYKLKCLAVLGGCSVDEIKSSIDFWMSDRAGDCTTFLENLDIQDEKALK